MSIRDLIAKKDRRLPARQGSVDSFSEFHREMNRLFDDFFTDFSVAPSWDRALDTPSAFLPTVNVSETAKEVNITAELPGMDKEDVSLELNDNTIVICGEKKQEREEKEKHWYRKEHTYGSFQRVIPLPASVETDKAKAEFKKGVLSIVIPKLPNAGEQRRTIEISGN